MIKLNVGFSVPIKPTLFAKAIMWVDGTKYDHAYIKWSFDQIDRELIYQASNLAVNFETTLKFATHAIVVEEYEVEISEDVFKKVVQFAFDNSDEDYSIKEIVGFAWMKLNKLFGRTINNPFPGDGTQWVCSVLATEILVIAGIITIDQPVENIDPLALNQIIKSVPAIKKVK